MRPSRERILDSAHTQVARVDDLPAQPMAPDLEALFREAYLRLHGRLLDHAERFLDHDRAADVVDDALAELYQRWPQITSRDQSDGYAFRMVQNRIFDALKAADRRVSLDEVDEELEARGTSPLDGDPTESDLAAILDHALAAMPPKRRATFLLIREESLGYDEAAEILGISHETVKWHMKSALADLRAAFTRAGIRIATPQQHRLPTPPGGATND